MRLTKLFIELLITVLIIIIVSCLPSFVQSINFTVFFNNIISSFIYLFNPNAIIIPQEYGSDVTLFHALEGYYSYSMIVLISSFIVALVLSLIFSFIFIKFSTKKRTLISSVLFLLETVPDVLIVVLIQFLFIWFFKVSDISLGVVALNDRHIYLLPIICLSFVPILQLFKYFSSFVEVEQSKDYSYFLKSKGLNENYVIIIHLFRNALIHFINHSKSIVLFMISNLLILELVLNMDGLMVFIKTYGIGDHRILMWCLILIYLPFSIFYGVVNIIINRKIVSGSGA